MEILVIILGLLISLATVFVLTPFLCRFAVRMNWTDRPTESRKIHKKTTPHVGGLAIFAGFITGLVYFYFVQGLISIPYSGFYQLPSLLILLGAAGMVGLGFYDDLFRIGFKRKFLFQIIVAVVAFWGGIQITEIVNPITGTAIYLGAMSLPVTVFVMLGVINAVNLLDGLDGLAGGVVIIVLLTLSLTYVSVGNYALFPMVVVVTGSLLGFLRYNFYPAAIFMGDTGSMFLGYIVACYAVVGIGSATTATSTLIPFIAIGLPLIDTAMSMIRRLMNHKSMFHADSDHIHHRVIRELKVSSRAAVMVLYTASVVFGIIAFALAHADPMLQTLLLFATLVLVVLFLKILNYIQVPDAVYKMVDKHIAARKESSYSGD
ncbi:MAG: undecaprenyl/decaprenyl-phosphate alpha-N-acetylglucosaminyl 1-phosphate transferase [Balneolaceae bacterium]|jgi:UDP-GlcNAc:undecaprenyl-phosphate GlcNAc-1-phosphate transferase|nr:MAG: undecaprenyl/decaprenyl-phosphate alpha-N-acetylglucosaminyl 1-phosphate transferase [Balneolaceae bacterium]